MAGADVLAAKGMTLYRFGKLLGYRHPHSVVTAFPKDGRFRRVSASLLNRVCEILEVTPGDVIEYVPDDPTVSQPHAPRKQRKN